MRNWHGRFPAEVFTTQSYAAELCLQHNARVLVILFQQAQSKHNMPARASVVFEEVRRVQDVIHTRCIQCLGHIVNTCADREAITAKAEFALDVQVQSK